MQYIDKPVSKEILQELLTNANHAPTHKRTEPWRFKVFSGEGKRRLGDFLAKKYKETTSDFDLSRFEKIKANIAKSGAILAIILHRDKAGRVPEWEEIASVACAVENIWIALDQYGLGGYWSTPPWCEYLDELVDLKENERCIGLFYVGHHALPDRVAPKGPIENKVEWIEE